MSKPIPQEAIDSLPDGYTLLGWGGDFDSHHKSVWVWGDNMWSPGWAGMLVDVLYAAPHDSEIVELNSKAGKLPHLCKSEDFLSGKTTMIPDKKPLPEDSAERKTYPMYSGLVAYFPHALAAVSNLSYRGNLQHHPDKPLHWDMDKSTDELDALMRHVVDEDWVHVAWRALANLERKLTGKCTYENK